MIREMAEMSCRTRRSRYPWFDRLTTLSEVEGVSSKPSPDLDSGQSLRDFRNDEIRARDERIVTCTTILAKALLRAICGPNPLLKAISFHDSLDSGFVNSYLFMGAET